MQALTGLHYNREFRAWKPMMSLILLNGDTVTGTIYIVQLCPKSNKCALSTFFGYNITSRSSISKRIYPDPMSKSEFGSISDPDP